MICLLYLLPVCRPAQRLLRAGSWTACLLHPCQAVLLLRCQYLPAGALPWSLDRKTEKEERMTREGRAKEEMEEKDRSREEEFRREHIFFLYDDIFGVKCCCCVFFMHNPEITCKSNSVGSRKQRVNLQIDL